MANDKESMPSIPTEDKKITQSSTILTLASRATTQIIHLSATTPQNFFTEETYIVGDGLVREYFGLGSLTDILPILGPKTLMHTISDGLMKKMSYLPSCWTP